MRPIWTGTGTPFPTMMLRQMVALGKKALCRAARRLHCLLLWVVQTHPPLEPRIVISNDEILLVDAEWDEGQTMPMLDR